MTTELWVWAAVTTPTDAQELVEAVARAVPGCLALVVPFDGPVPDPDAGVSRPLDETLWGSLIGEDIECRWRVEGDRCAVSVVSTTARAGLHLQRVEVEAAEPEPLAWHPSLRALRQRGDPYRVVYRRDGRPELTRTGVRR